jgi:hypothetical protein
MGSETTTYKDLQIQPLMSHPEKVYKQYMLEAFKEINGGMRAVNNAFQMGIIDTRSMFNDGFLTNLGYNPSETIKYTLLDPALVLSWLRTNVSAEVENNVSASWRAPTLEEIAIEYLQDTYSGMILAEKSFLIDGVRWFVSGIVSTSPTTTDATCYKDRWVTASASIPLEDIESIEDLIYKDGGVNYWKVNTIGETVHVNVEYMTIQCPGVINDVVQATVDKYNNSIHTSIYESEPDPESGTSGWEATVKVSVYIDDSGEIIVTGSIVTFTSNGWWGGGYNSDAQRAAIADVVGKVENLIEEEIVDNLKRLVAYYKIADVQKIKIAEIPIGSVSTTANAKAYPIIPLKENFGFIKESRGMKVVLNKLGMNNGDFKSSLADSHIRNAAILFVLELNDNNPAVVKAIYETLTQMVRTTLPGGKGGSSTGYQLDLGFTQVNFKTKVIFTLETKSGSIGPIGTYTVGTKSVFISGDSNGEGSSSSYYETYKVIRKQLTADYYEELELSPKSSTTWRVGGYELSKRDRNNSDKDLSEVYIPIVDIGLKALKYEELHYVLARSMNMLVLSITVVKSKWYQSGFFKFVMMVVVAVVAYFTGGAAYAAYGALAAGVVYAAAAITILGIMGVDTGVLGQVIQVAAAVVTFGTSLASTPFEIALTSASTLTQFAVIASDINMRGSMEALQEKAKATQAELGESEKLVEEIAENTQKGLWTGIEDRSPDMLYALSSTDLMCSYDILYDYDSVMEGMIKSVGV